MLGARVREGGGGGCEGELGNDGGGGWRRRGRDDEAVG